MFLKKPIEKWDGPFILRNVEGELVMLDTDFRTILVATDRESLYPEL